MEMLRQLLLQGETDFGLLTILGLALANMVLGAAVALANKEFKLYRLADIFAKTAPLLLAYGATVVLGNEAMRVLVLGSVSASLSGSILKNLGHLFPGLNLPDALIEPAFKRTAFNASKHTAQERKARQG